MPALAVAVHDLDELDRLLLHLHDQAVDRRAEVAVEDHAGYRHDQAERRVVQGDRNAVRELQRDWSRAAVCEPKISIIPTTVPNRPISGDIAAIVPSVVEKALEVVGDDAPDLLDRFLDHVARAFHVREADGEESGRAVPAARCG